MLRSWLSLALLWHPARSFCNALNSNAPFRLRSQRFLGTSSPAFLYSLAHAWVNIQAKAFMFARMPWFLIHWHVFGTFLRVMQWTSHCVHWQIDFVGVLFGLWPRFLLFCGALLFASQFPLAKRKSGWGICGSSCLFGFCGFCVLYLSICLLNGHVMSFYKRLSFSLCSCKDRAFSATSATLKEKKRANSC